MKLTLANGDDAPDVFGAGEAFVHKYVESDKLMVLDDVYQSYRDGYPIPIGTGAPFKHDGRPVPASFRSSPRLGARSTLPASLLLALPPLVCRRG